MKQFFPIAGMHCRSCEILIERHLSALPGVHRVNVNYRTGIATIRFANDATPNTEAIAQAVRAAGYRLGHTRPRAFINTNLNDWTEFWFAGCIVFALYLFANIFGLTQITATASSGAGPSVALLIGLVAGISSCAALIGGLVLAISARHAELHPTASSLQKFRPHLFFNAGRIVAFTVLGGAIGLLGSAFQPSTRLLGILTILIGFVMLSLGLKLTELFPRISALLVLPSGIARMLGITRNEREYSHSRAALTGALTFFLPCGFTQAMQLTAVASGSFTAGAVIMGAFALGTVPGLLGIGGISAIVRGSFARLFFKTAGIIVLLLGIWNISNGWNLTGFVLSRPAAQATTAVVRNGEQVLTMEQRGNGYVPNRFTVKKGIPVIWTINSTNPYSCASSLRVPSLGISRSLAPGMNIIRFTPTKTGIIRFSCSMGMYSGTIEVLQ